MRASTQHARSEWTPGNPSAARDWGAEDSQRWALRGWFFGSLMIWCGSLFALASQGLIEPRAIPVGMLPWPLFLGGVALPFARLLEHRAKARDRRELAGLERQRQEASLQRLEARLHEEPRNLEAALNAIRESFQAPRTTCLPWITATVGNTTRMIATRDVLFFQAGDGCTRVVT